jgi:NADPH:quinone reductase-like Zn-dependent oxidoreductase
VWPLLERGEVRPIVDKVFPLARAADAHRALEAGEVIGKVVLVP